MIAIPVKDTGDNPEVDERFGRCAFFCIIDDKGTKTFIENSAKDLSSGAGGQAVSILANNDVDVIIAPHIGPKSMTPILELGIKVFSVGNAKTVSEALEGLKLNILKAVGEEKPGLRRV
ncbi:MAG: NifB/NifX family molybdenum-iron cluster-binding protein [Spirochaetales bacterium]|nr:NifB/NifX family molybdenum-iron cluster-binding protein [Spirochaetales bacterium]